ncbi:AAA family ATPase [Variovorax soli]|uniref:ATPase AAA-type core domain-containing protein n=1 Tax=Variovorax soli TaxID=376815 RepID=A0ABU1NAX6_9BURK|nr:AAA family ATPase [Variovorax soli]MDR6535602.1 hypothetical protein [Variovorax soli]
MELIGYRVTNFRSVGDSGWIDADRVTSLIGVNESGKTNLLIPLWKFNPAQEGELQPTADYPKRLFGKIRDDPGSYQFITVRFTLDEPFATKIGEMAGIASNVSAQVDVTRYFDGEYTIEFPLYSRAPLMPERVNAVLAAAKDQLATLAPLKAEESAHSGLLERLARLQEEMLHGTGSVVVRLRTVLSVVKQQIPESVAKTSVIYPRLTQAVEELQAVLSEATAPDPSDKEGVLEAVVEALPKFLYYSNYGNLDSEIYLPHVVENLKRADLGAKEAAKSRTLRVLFKFVSLQPDEILQLGKDFNDPTRQPTHAEIEAIAEKKRERSILLQSAGTALTTRFKEWWKQGDYRFRFEADGDHFRIWVADDRRPEEIELESRSTGLQWFLSFYLVFLVESQGGAHQSAILLLDEPGLSLHPLAQRDLALFFDGLSKTNQIIFTTHSPFLVDADRLDRVRKVYVDDDGTTKASPDLRQSTGKNAQAGAAYAVYSALNLNVSESLLLGCQPVVVEGPSDQHYLTAIKVLLISGGRISPVRELVFPPGGGTKTLRITAGILTGRDEVLPVTLLDGDTPGLRMISELSTSLYSSEKKKLFCTDDYVEFSGSEVEDLFPPKLVAEAVDRYERSADTLFADVVQSGKPIVPQIEAWAKSHSISLQLGWKVEVAKRVKQSALNAGISSFDEPTLARWTKLFGDLLSASK